MIQGILRCQIFCLESVLKGEERCRSGKESRALEMAMSGGLLLCCREKRGYSVYRLAVLNESAKRGYGIMLVLLSNLVTKRRKAL